MKRAVLCHCWGGHPEFIWYPYLKTKLKDAGFKVEIPMMPDTDHPVVQSWLPAFSKAVGEICEDDILIGHSGDVPRSYVSWNLSAEIRKSVVLSWLPGFLMTVGIQKSAHFSRMNSIMKT